MYVLESDKLNPNVAVYIAAYGKTVKFKDCRLETKDKLVADTLVANGYKLISKPEEPKPTVVESKPKQSRNKGTE